MRTDSNLGRFTRSGALAGAFSVVAFTIIHDLFISDIWYMLMLMIVAGVLCGLCLGWTYALLFPKPSAGSWLGYNLIYLVMFVLLGIASVLVFEPITTAAAVSAVDEPPGELIAQAMPMTALFTLAVAALVSWRFGRKWTHYAAILLTCVVLVLLLGLNVSIIGLVAFPSSSLYLVAELFGLILALNAVYVITFMALERKRLPTKPDS
jgi:hypothetical protein